MNSLKISLRYDDLKSFLNVTSKFKSKIYMKKGRYVVDAKSIMGILSIDFSNEVEVEIITNNEDELIRFFKDMEEFK